MDPLSHARSTAQTPSKIWMSPSSELGPVDPQIIREEDGQVKVFSAYSIVDTYEKLFRGSVRVKGNLQPYLQQLARFDVRDIAKYKSYIDLSDDIALKCLKSGMLKGKTQAVIKKGVKVFLDPSAGTVSHGRPIYAPEAKSCGLVIEDLDVKTEIWKDLYELYVRIDTYVTRFTSKAVESKDNGFYSPRIG